MPSRSQDLCSGIPAVISGNVILGLQAHVGGDHDDVGLIADLGDGALDGLDDLFNKKPERVHPVIAAMNFMKFDAMTVGNHEFNWGLENILILVQGQVDAGNFRAEAADPGHGDVADLLVDGGVGVAHLKYVHLGVHFQRRRPFQV